MNRVPNVTKLRRITYDPSVDTRYFALLELISAAQIKQEMAKSERRKPSAVRKSTIYETYIFK